MRYPLIVILSLTLSFTLSAQTTWVDSMDTYAREKFLPAGKYKWTWQNAALLKVMVQQYDMAPPAEKRLYLNYVKKAMDRRYRRANGHTPNAVASGLGMAFLWRVTGEQRYLEKALEIYEDYLGIKRTPGGGVSHLRWFYELWDDTVFMIGQFMLEMYKATGEEKYLDELVQQITIHREKLADPDWGLWYHGWDADEKSHITFCSQNKWQDEDTRQSSQFWGRGNGWVVVTLSDALMTIPNDHEYYELLSGYLQEMLVHLPELQDTTTGHWYQLPLFPGDSDNYIESSATAMFAYGINTALRLGLVNGGEYRQCVDLAYEGLRRHSTAEEGNGYLNVANVCKGTCIGNKKYYYGRKTKIGSPYGLGAFIQFGRNYEADHLEAE